MKLAKKMILLFLLERQERTGSSRADYSILYRHLPLAPSTIRGILQEFLRLRLVEREGEGEYFSLTTRGSREASKVFLIFSSRAPEQRGSLLIELTRRRATTRQASTSGMQRAGWYLLAPGVFLRPGPLASSDKRLVLEEGRMLFENVWLDPENLEDAILGTRSGIELLERRKTLRRLVRIYHSKLSTYSAGSTTLQSSKRSLMKMLCAEVESSHPFLENILRKEDQLLQICAMFFSR